MKRLIAFFFLCCVITLSLRSPNDIVFSQAGKVDFNRDIRPILSDNCFQCHGPDDKARMAKLRFDTKDGAFAKAGVITPGDADNSRLIKRVTSANADLLMPPPATGHKLSEAQIATLKRWIDEGAAWGSHWAFIAPQRAPLPAVKNQAWIKNAIDAFVLARLEKEGLAPSPAADRATLLRRVSFDLTGLPPTLKELDDFLNDQSPSAYEKVVDRLLSSPRFGERMAFRWLDAARYADTNGYQVDGERSMWRWRDYVIEAFNDNLPFDQFIIEQLAGDLLPNATIEQRIATGFNRNHRLNAEGGIVPEEYRIEYVVDRVDTTSTVFMGLTMGCARCHSHKYDPLTHKEFYQFSAFFNNIDEDGHSFDQGNAPPLMHAPTRDEQARLAQFDREVTQSETTLQALLTKHAAAQVRWEKSLSSKPSGQQWFPDEKLIVHVPFDENAPAVFNQSDRDYHDKYDRKKEDPEIKFETGWRNGTPRYVASPLGSGAAFDHQLYFDGGMHADFRYKTTSKDYRERFTIAAWVKADNEQAGTIVSKVGDSPADVENGVPRAEGYGLYLANGKLHFNMVFRWGEDTLRVETADKLPLNQWQHVAVVFDGLEQWERRLRIYVNGLEQKLKFNQRNFFLLFGGSKNTLKIGAGGGPQFRWQGALDEMRMYSRALASDEIALLANAESLNQLVALAPAKRNATQSMKLQRAFLAQAAPRDLQQAFQQLNALKQERQAFIDDLPTTMVMAEMATPRPAYLLKRGAYDSPVEPVERIVPAVLPPMASDLPRNRLGLARWLVSKEHPLTARVTANRFWQMLFGTGLVKTAEDFGSQGEPPTHPELLDWLALEFQSTDCGVRNAVCQNPNWNVKRLLKTIVTSATYQQTSARSASNEDVENRLLSRGPRTRLSVEMIRDQALLLSGLLVEKRGGPSVKPYQPEGIYKDMGFGGAAGYSQAKGEGLWRRSLYTYWKRTLLSPTMSVFDASTREFCTVKETRTNTPLQSLNLMNDVTYVEAARMLAERMLVEGGNDAAARLAWGFRVVTSRAPSSGELQVLMRDLQKQLAYFAAQPDEAKKLLATGERRNRADLPANEVAAYAMVASLLLNMDEAITKQ